VADTSNAGNTSDAGPVEITDFKSPAERLGELGLPRTELSGITILPRGLFAASDKKDLVYEDSSWDVRAALRAEGFDVNVLIEPVRTIQENAFEWLLPALHVAKDAIETADGLKHLINGLRRIYSLARNRSGVKAPVRFKLLSEDRHGNTKRLTVDAQSATDIETLAETIIKVFNEIS
jgi:hypothetical protein